jgi:hypothetical protein
MKINDWIEAYKKSGGSVISFAADVQVTDGAVYRWLSGKSTPNVITALKIKAVTGGLVRPEDWKREGAE